MKPEKVEAAVDELWRGKKKGERVVADILPRPLPPKERKIEEISPPPVKERVEPAPVIKFERPRKKLSGRFWRRSASVLVGAGILTAGALIILPKTDITVTLKKLPLDFEETIEAGKDVFTAAAGNGKISIPAELLSATKNIELSFPASGREKVELKAKGQLKVYNAFSSEPQALVANTRFLSPEGKIFRLVKAVTVPGAKVAGGQIAPSAINVEVAADKPGPEYNLEASVGQWRIPGFSGTPKYEKFYAEAIGSLTGGFVGEKAVPTQDDINQGKEKSEQTLRDAIQSQMVAIEENLKFLEGTASFKVTKMEAEEVADENGLFSIFSEAEMKQIGFAENLLKEALMNKLKAPLESDLGYLLEEKSFAVDYGQPAVDFDKGQLSFNVKGSVVFQAPFNVAGFKKEIAGLGENELKSKTFGITGLERARISFWPFWVHSVPARASRINVTVE